MARKSSSSPPSALAQPTSMRHSSARSRPRAAATGPGGARPPWPRRSRCRGEGRRALTRPASPEARSPAASRSDPSPPRARADRRPRRAPRSSPRCSRALRSPLAHLVPALSSNAIASAAASRAAASGDRVVEQGVAHVPRSLPARAIGPVRQRPATCCAPRQGTARSPLGVARRTVEGRGSHEQRRCPLGSCPPGGRPTVGGPANLARGQGAARDGRSRSHQRAGPALRGRQNTTSSEAPARAGFPVSVQAPTRVEAAGRRSGAIPIASNSARTRRATIEYPAALGW